RLASQGQETPIEVRRTIAGPFFSAKDAAGMQTAAFTAFEKLGNTALALDSFSFHNPENRFVPVSRLNQLRRDVVTEVEEILQRELNRRVARLQTEFCPAKVALQETPSFRWSIKVDRIGFVDLLEDSDLIDLEEIVVDIA